MSVTIERVVEASVATRTQLEALRSECKALEVVLEKRGHWLRGELEKLRVDSYETPHGTVLVIGTDVQIRRK